MHNHANLMITVSGNVPDYQSAPPTSTDPPPPSNPMTASDAPPPQPPPQPPTQISQYQYPQYQAGSYWILWSISIYLSSSIWW